jgi:hypothetical protein
MLSIAQSNDIRCTTFFTQEFDKFSDLGDTITKNIWSPIIFKNNRRSGANFEASMFIAIDMDDGNTLKPIHKSLEELGLMYLIGLTRNHQKWKGNKPPCDRYRIVLAADNFCEIPEDYQYTIEMFIKSLRSDNSCKDLARCYFPCSEIYAVKDHGHFVQWLQKPTQKQKQKSEIKVINQGRIMEYLSGKRLIKSKSRHMTLFAAICDLRRLGCDDDQIMQIVISSKLGSELIAEDGEKEIERYVRSSEKYL